MPSRQRGAAHVNIFFFLIMLVLFLGALGFAYITLEKNTELKDQVATAQARVERIEGQQLLLQHYQEDLAAQVGETGEYSGRAGFNYDGDPAPLQNVALPSRVGEAMDQFARELQMPSTKELAPLFSSVKNTVDAYKAQVRNLESERTTLQNQIAELQGSINDLTAAHKAREAELSREMSQRADDYTADIAQKEGMLQAQSQEYRTLREQKSDEAAEHARAVAAMRKDLETTQAQVDALGNKVKLVNPADAADGMVLDASQATGLAWINIGRDAMLPRGTTFEIVDAGSDRVKAYGTVSQVEENRAELRITGLKDRFDPVVPGDQVRNDLFSPDMRHNIYLMGRFSQPFTRPLVKTILEDLGNRVVDELGPGVDLIILGADTVNEEGSGFTPITETEEYKKAQFLRIEMAPLSKVRQYLRLSDDLASR